jgi:hypothetical protein
MKSSSKLFPVSLIDAEYIGRYYLDSYLLKPNNSANSQIEFALHHFGCKKTLADKPPLLLVHGLFSNRLDFYDMMGEGFAPRLADAGFDLWIMELRGHGSSPIKLDYQKNTLQDIAQFDLTSAIDFLREETRQNPVLFTLSEASVLPILNASIQSKIAAWVIQGDQLFSKGKRQFKKDLIFNNKIKLFEKKLCDEPETRAMVDSFKATTRRFRVWSAFEGFELAVPALALVSESFLHTRDRDMQGVVEFSGSCWGQHGLDVSAYEVLIKWLQALD